MQDRLQPCHLFYQHHKQWDVQQMCGAVITWSNGKLTSPTWVCSAAGLDTLTLPTLHHSHIFFSPLPPVPPAGQFLYDTTGTFTFTPPSGVTQVSVLCTAGGGGAGSFVGGTGSAAGGGGGGTCYANK